MDIRKEESGKQMGKIETLSDYIGRCDDNMIDDEEKYNFIEEVRSVYGEEIRGFETGLSAYCVSAVNTSDYIDFDEDICKVKAKLINYKDNLQMAQKERAEALKPQQTSIQIMNHMQNNQIVDIGILTGNMLTAAEQLLNVGLTEEECHKIKEILSELKKETDKKETKQAKKILYELVKFLTDKGADVLIALIPYLGSMAKKIIS